MKIKTGFVTQTLGDKTIVVGTGELSKTFHGMIQLNATGSDIWQWLAEGLSEQQTAEKLADKYDVTLETAVVDVRKFITQMEVAEVFEK